MAPQNLNKMGKWGATSYIIGNIIGSGIFIAPNTVLKESGSSVGISLVVWVLSAIIATLGAFCYVELGTRIRKSGGDFAYLSFVKWHAFAFAFMCCGCILLFPVILAIQSETFAEYFLQGLHIRFCSETTNLIAKKLISFSTIWLLLYLNFFSVQKIVAKFQILASIAKILSCMIIIGTGLFFLCFREKPLSNLSNPFDNWQKSNGENQLTSAFFAGLYAYDGWDVLNFGVEDLKNPRSSLKFAIIFGMSTVGGVFIAMNLSFFVVLDANQISSSSAVAITFARHSLGSCQYIMSLLVSIVLIGSMNSTMFSASRYLYAAARSGAFPRFVSCTNTDHDSPRAALFLHVILAMCFSFIGNLKDLLDHVGFAQWIQRSLTIIALLYIRYRSMRGKDFNFPTDILKTPIIIPIIFLIACLLLIIVTAMKYFIQTALITLSVILLGFILYFFFIFNRFEKFNQIRMESAVYKKLSCINTEMSKFTQIFLNGVIDVDSEEIKSVHQAYSNDTPKMDLANSIVSVNCNDNSENVTKRKFVKKHRVHTAEKF